MTVVLAGTHLTRDEAMLTAYDDWAHAEAMVAPGFAPQLAPS